MPETKKLFFYKNQERRAREEEIVNTEHNILLWLCEVILCLIVNVDNNLVFVSSLINKSSWF